MSDELEQNGECTIPSRIPPDEARKYSVTRDPHAERDIADYVETQSPDEKVLNVERVRAEYVIGKRYEIWDVSTDKNRWWVLTNLTNLYSHEHFPSLDYTLSFHIGLMARLAERSSKQTNNEPDLFDEVARRQEQAHERYDQAVEYEDFQAVGMLLREALISMATTLRRRTFASESADATKASDFVGWVDKMIDHWCPGPKNKDLRSYLKNNSKKLWQLVNWLTHDRNANQTAASICLHGFDTIFGNLAQLLIRDETENTEHCPQCNSNDIRPHFDISLSESGEYYASCGQCFWTSHPDSQEHDQPQR